MKLSLTKHNGMEVIRKCGVVDNEKPLYKLDPNGLYCYPRYTYQLNGDQVLVHEAGRLVGYIPNDAGVTSHSSYTTIT